MMRFHVETPSHEYTINFQEKATQGWGTLLIEKKSKTDPSTLMVCPSVGCFRIAEGTTPIVEVMKSLSICGLREGDFERVESPLVLPLNPDRAGIRISGVILTMRVGETDDTIMEFDGLVTDDEGSATAESWSPLIFYQEVSAEDPESMP
jgi:hypothetical protein